MGSKEAAALVTTVLAVGLVLRRVPRHGRPSTLLGLFALLGGDSRDGRPVYLLVAWLLGGGLIIWALRVFHLAFYGPN